MRVGIFHGFELTGSGSNEYTRYLSRALARLGHEVHVLCREPSPESIDHVARAFLWDRAGNCHISFERDVDGGITLHQLPHGDVRPVYLTDKQRSGHVKAFESLTDEELSAYHELNVRVVNRVLDAHPVDLVHTNHLIWQPSVLADTEHPFVVFPHGSAIEYTVRRDERYRHHAAKALVAAKGIISGNQEVLERIFTLYPDARDTLEAKSVIVGVGVDTSLFRPVQRSDRAASVSRVEGRPEGKSPAQTLELTDRLDAGDYEALTKFRGTYDQSVPDEDVAGKLARIPWEEGRVLMFVGALTAGKGIQTLLCGLPRILDKHPDTHLVVIGSGAYREVLEALVHAMANGNQDLFAYLVRHGFDLDRSELEGGWDGIGSRVPSSPHLDEHVHFLGRLPHSLLKDVAPCADVAVFPSVVPEAYPLVLMESLANGVFPVVSDFSGFADGLEQLDRLLGDDLVDKLRIPYAPEQRLDGLVERVSSLLDEPPDDAMRQRLRAVAVEHFDWDVRARQMADAYERFVV